MGEGKTQDEALGKCYGMYKEYKSMDLSKGVRKSLRELQSVIKNLEREEVYKSTINEIPNTILGLFNPQGQAKYKQIYLDNRLAGKSVDESLDVSSRLVTRTYKDNRLTVLKGIQVELKRLLVKKADFYPDETLPENWGPDREDIPVIDEFDEQPDEEKVKDDDKVGKAEDKECKEEEEETIEKAEEGDTKMIFGKPAKFTGGKWVIDGDGKKKEPEGEKKPKKEPKSPIGSGKHYFDMSPEEKKIVDNKVKELRNDPEGKEAVSSIKRFFDKDIIPEVNDTLKWEIVSGNIKSGSDLKNYVNQMIEEHQEGY